MENKNIIKWYDFLWLWILPTITITDRSLNDMTVTIYVKRFRGITYIIGSKYA